MKIICTLPNASDSLNGIAFKDHPKGKISVEDVPKEQAEVFLSVPGFEEAAAAPKAPAATGGKKKAPEPVAPPADGTQAPDGAQGESAPAGEGEQK